MKSFVSLLLLSAFLACAYANPIAPEEDVFIDKRFIFGHHHGGLFGKIIHGIKHTAEDVKKGLEHAGKEIAHTGEKVVHTIGDVAKKFGHSTEKVVNDIVKKFKVGGKFVARFVDKNEKEIGHFFAKEGKEVGHTFVAAGKKIEHVARDAYEKARDAAKAGLKQIDFDALLFQLVKMIDSPWTEMGCAELAKNAAVVVAGPEIEPAVQAAGPIIKLVCHAALDVLEMAAKTGANKAHINKVLHHL